MKAHSYSIPREHAPSELVQAFDRMMETYRATDGKPWDAAEWDAHENARREYRDTCIRLGFKQIRYRGALAVYPQID